MKRKQDQMALHLMMLPGMILLAIFSFTPMFGIIMAFQNYMPARGIAKSPCASAISSFASAVFSSSVCKPSSYSF